MRSRALIASLLISVAFFVTACGGGEAEDSTSNGSTQNQQPVATTGDTTTTDETLEVVNPVGSDGKLTLSLNLPVGKTFRLTVTQNEIATESSLDQTIENQSSSELSYLFHVESSESGSTVLDGTFESYKTSSPAAGGSLFEFDSENMTDSEAPEAKVFSALIGQEFTVELGSTGEVRSFTGMEDWFAGVMGEIEPVVREWVEPMFAELFSSDAMAQGLKNIFVTFPETPVGPGDSWSNDPIRLPGAVPMKIGSTYSVESISNGEVVLNVDSTLSLQADAAPIQIGPISMSYKSLSGKQSGTITIDQNTGWLLRGSSELEFATSLEFEDIEDSDGGIPITGKTTVTYTSLEVDDEDH